MSLMFQSTLPRGERPVGRATAPVLLFVSIHAPAWGATSVLFFALHLYLCFNPRSRVGSDMVIGNEVLTRAVSIHAPAWGATSSYCQAYGHWAVSIHAPAWGATPTRCTRWPYLVKFQSTLPRGERQS